MDAGVVPVPKSCTIFSLGINNEWSFDKKFEGMIERREYFRQQCIDTIAKIFSSFCKSTDVKSTHSIHR